MAAARSGIFSFPPWMVAFFVRASTGHIGIFSLVMAITSDKGGHLYENHHAHRCHKVKKEKLSSSFNILILAWGSCWFRWGVYALIEVLDIISTSEMAPMTSH